MSAAAIYSNTRASRSRFSSPQTAPNGTTDSSRGQATNGTESQKQFMQRWLEPPVQVKPSYQDDGLVRHGVVENMAPLGTLPKAGFFKKTAPPPPPAPEQSAQATPIRKIVVKRPAAPPAPVPTPAVAPEEDETEEEEGVGTENVGNDQGDEDVKDAQGMGGATVAGRGKTRTTAAGSRSRSRRSVASWDRDDEDWAPGKSSQKAAGRRSLSSASAGRLGSTASTASLPQTAAANEGSQRADLKEFTDKVVEAAVDEALSHFRYPTAWALRTLYDENSSDPDFLAMIEKVFAQTADDATLVEFARLVRAKKQEGKKDDKACYYFVPPSTNSRFTPHKPKRAPYANLLQLDLSPLRLGQPRSRPQKAEQARQQSEPEAADREPDIKAEPEPEPEPEPEFPPRKRRKSNRHAESASKMTITRANGANGVKSNAETPSRRRTRARSMSSSSTLSSARSLTPPADDEERDGFDAAAPSSSRTSPAAQQPITSKKRRFNAPRKSRNVSPSPRPSPAPSTSTAPQQQASASRSQPQPLPAKKVAVAPEEGQPYEMPAVVDSPLFPNLNSKKGAKSGAPVPVFPSKVGRLDPNDENLLLREQARKHTLQNAKQQRISNVRQSSSRAASSRAGEADDELDNPAAALATPAPSSSARARPSLPAARPTPAPPREGRSTRSSLKRTHDELEDQPSPTTANFPGSEAASTAADSRAGTPALRATTKKTTRTGLRVKTSPMKKKNGTSAGIPRPSGERSSPVGNGNANREDDNDDYCSSCGGNGELICCDGCTRSFHFNCVDPVIMQDSMPVEWFCNVCRARRDPASLPGHSGAFALMLEKLDAKNSSAFRLPALVRDCFEGVRTGVDGEYEEAVPTTKPARKKKNEEEQTPDFFRLTDQEGNPVICHGCQKSSSSNRAIIPCSVCGIYWHTDCLDPPLSNPPIPARNWKCPLHVDDMTSKVPGVLGPAHRPRRVKNAPVIRPAFSRGFTNNGLIEVEPDLDEDHSGWRNVETYGRIVRLPEKGILLDFLSRSARENRKGKPIPPLNHASTPVESAPAPLPFEQRPLAEQQAALNLSQLSGHGPAGIATLVDAMISQADPTVIDLMARANPSHLDSAAALTNMDQQSLRAILARAEVLTQRIRELLAVSTPAPEPQSIPQSTASTANAAEDPAALVPSLTSSPTDGDSDNATNVEADAGALDADADTGDKGLAASPAASDDDDVPAMTHGDKTPVQGDQSPAAPPGGEEEDPRAGAGGDGKALLPPTPTKATAGAGDEPVVLEPHGDGEKTLVDEEGRMEID